jgi:hypothetical protein
MSGNFKTISKWGPVLEILLQRQSTSLPKATIDKLHWSLLYSCDIASLSFIRWSVLIFDITRLDRHKMSSSSTASSENITPTPNGPSSGVWSCLVTIRNLVIVYHISFLEVVRQLQRPTLGGQRVALPKPTGYEKTRKACKTGGKSMRRCVASYKRDRASLNSFPRAFSQYHLPGDLLEGMVMILLLQHQHHR